MGSGVEALEKNLNDLGSALNQYANDIETTRQRSMAMIEEKSAELDANAQLAHTKVHACIGLPALHTCATKRNHTNATVMQLLTTCHQAH